MKTPTTQELADQHLSQLEGSLSQTAPLNEKAFLRVLAALLAMGHTGIYKLLAERTLQNLVLTATGEDLDRLGAGEQVYRKAAEAAELSVSVLAGDGTVVPVTASLTGDSNGVMYSVNSSAAAVGGAAVLSITAGDPGAAGNLQDGDTLTLVSPVVGAALTGTVLSTLNTGADAELDEPYRQRILLKMRSTTGGGNSTDYRMWGEAVAGVAHIFPYSGKPPGSGTSYPGDRTLFVESDSTVDPDGIAPSGLLDDVRAAVLINPVTGKARPTLGDTPGSLYIEPITRTTFNLTVTNLITPTGAEASVRAKLEAAAALFFRSFAPFIDGLDSPQERNDRVTTPALATAVQEVLETTGSSAAAVSFDVASTEYTAYQLSAGERGKLGTVDYATV